MLLRILINRFAFGSAGTLGGLTIWDEDNALQFECLTLERPTFPWVRANEPWIACIPEGEYRAKLGMFYRNTADPSDDYPAYEILDVPGRTLIKIHRANFASQIHGCIALGDRFDWDAVQGLPAVRNTRTTFANFMAALDGQENVPIIIAEIRAELPGAPDGS